jgi:DNA transformation protein
MPVSRQFHEFVIDQLGAVRAVSSRRMFGGVGFYAGEWFFAIASDDTLYFKVSDQTRPDYEREGMKPFAPFADDARPMRGYYEVPARVLEDSEQLAEWMQRAISVAASRALKTPRRTASRPRRSTPSRKRPRT